MKIKVCGMRDPDNIRAVAACGPDLMGFIFYPASPRAADPDVLATVLPGLPAATATTGVWVNAPVPEMVGTARRLGLGLVQLHGSESPDVCSAMRDEGFRVIRAFPVDGAPDWSALEPFLSCTDFFLFDTRTPGHGGSGKKFDHSVLHGYPFAHPFLLSGGIGPEDAAHLARHPFPMQWGVDLNSRFETSPGVKSTALLETFFHTFRTTP